MGKKQKKRGPSDCSSLQKKARSEGQPLAKLKEAISVLEVIATRPAIFEDAQMKGFRQAVWPLMERLRHQHFEPRLDKPSVDDPKQIMCAENINCTIELAEYCNRNIEMFESPDMKAWRRALHPLVLHFFRKSKGKGCGGDTEVNEMKKGTLLSALFQAKKYKDALEHVRAWTETIALTKSGKNLQEEIKLGSMQRWVRHASIEKDDWLGGERGGIERMTMSILLLDALLRLVAAYRGCGAASESEMNEDRESSSGEITLHDPFTVGPSAACAQNENVTTAISSKLNITWTIVHTQKGPDRRPPTEHDLNYYYPAANSIRYDGTGLKTRRHDIPFLQGAFVLSDVLSAAECSQLLALSKLIGFVPDAVDGIDNFNMLAHSSILDPVYERCRTLLPAHLYIKGRKRTLAGINARLRFFRYAEDSVYRPHIDGGWPGSGLKDDTGEFTDDYFGDRHSQFTFLVYLNDDFEGGHTTFYSPKKGTGLLQWGGIDARRVQPRMGSVLVFPHGTFEAPVHEGSATTRGIKYVIRTDVLYSL